MSKGGDEEFNHQPWNLRIQMGSFLDDNAPNSEAEDIHKYQIRHWAQEARGRCQSLITQQRTFAQKEIKAIDDINQKLDQEEEVRQLHLESIAALTNLDLRVRLKAKRQLESIRKDADLRASSRLYHKTIEEHFEHRKGNKNAVVASESLAILERLGKKLADQGKKLTAQLEPPKGIEELPKAAETNRRRHTPVMLGAEGPLHLMCNGWMTMVHVDGPRAKTRTAVLHATGPILLHTRPEQAYWQELGTRLADTSTLNKVAELIIVMLQWAADSFRDNDNAFHMIPVIENDEFVVQGVLHTVQATLKQFDFEELSNAIKAKMSLSQLKSFAQEMRVQLQHVATTSGRYYMEIFNNNQKDRWTIGFAAPPFPTKGFKFKKVSDVASFGVSSDGTYTANAMKRYDLAFLAQLKLVTVLGVVIDLVNGRIEISLDGEKPIIMFGQGAEHFQEKEQTQQIKIICSQTLIPTFALEGPLSTVARPPEQRKPVQKKPKTLRHRVSLREKSPVKKNASQQGIMERLSGIQDKPNNPNTPGQNLKIVSSRNQQNLIGHLRAQLSINLGRCRLQHLPMDCVPANFLPPFNPAALDTPSLFGSDVIKQGRVAKQKPKKEEKAEESYFDEIDPAKVSWSHFPPESHEKHQAGLIITRITNKWLKKRKHKKNEGQRIKAAISIQKSFRAYRVRTMGKHHHAASKIFSVWKGVKARKTFRLLNEFNQSFHDLERVAIILQSAFRMSIAKNTAKELAGHQIKRAKFLLGLTVMIQRRFRKRKGYGYRNPQRTNWKDRTMELENKRAREVEEKTWVQLCDYTPTDIARITMVQANFRGYVSRKMIKRMNRNLHNQLQIIQNNLVQHERAVWAAHKVQSWWRSKHASKKFQTMLWNLQTGMGIVVQAFRRTAARTQLENLAALNPALLKREPVSPRKRPRAHDSPRAGDKDMRHGSAVIGDGNGIDVLKYFLDCFEYPSAVGNVAFSKLAD